TRTEKENILRKMAFHSTQVGGKIDTYFVNDALDAETFGYGTEIKVRISYEMMKAAQEKGFFVTDLDYFGMKEDYYKEEIKRMLEEIRGCFGVPVAFDEAQNDDSDSISKFLENCFGKCFVNIKSNHVQMVVKGEESKASNGFSCWDEKNKVLIRYKHLLERKRSHPMKVYLNEILVDSYPLNKIFNIDFWETEVYLFSSHAENFIEINREGFLNEKQWYISGKICDTHLSCIRILLGNSLEQEYQQIVWPDIFYKNVKTYYEFLLLGHRALTADIGIRVYIRENKILYGFTKCEWKDICSGENVDSNKKLNDNVWLIDMRHRYMGDIRLKRTYTKVGYIVEDILYGYQSRAVSEMEVLEDLYGDRLILYKTVERSGMPVKISKESIRQYILYKYYVDKSNRLILPGLEEYKDIRVVKLIGSLGTEFEKRFDSAIIFPIPLPEFECLLAESKNNSDFERYIEDTFSKENQVYGRIVSYIKRYGCNCGGKFNSEEVKKNYRDLIIYVWKVITDVKK
ncbi:MAG: hypothetical protein K2H45_09395, partial [Acetatifactor sp.]|nr:hypothetical protein [Acetatifactor sp.]